MDITFPSIPALRGDEPAYIETLTPDLLGYIFTLTESNAAESFVSPQFYQASRTDLVCNYFFSELQSIVGEDYFDDFDTLIDRQEGDSWVVLNKKAIKYFNDLRKQAGFSSIVLRKKKGDYFSTSLISIYRKFYQKVVDKNLFSFCKAIKSARKSKDLNALLTKNKPALIRRYLKENNPLQREDYLNFDGQYLTLVPPEVCECTNLKMLNLRTSILTTLPKSFSNLVNLTTCSLALVHNFPSSLLTLTTLKTLDLWGSQEIKFPMAFGRLTTLTEFRLENKPLKNLPSSFSSLESLTKLDLSLTSIEDVPPCLFGLSNLRTLIFGGNIEDPKPMNFPKSFGSLTNLSTLKLEDYPITNPSESLSGLVNLTTLNFTNTKIEIFPTWIFKLTNLRKLIFKIHPDEDHKLMSFPKSLDNRLTNLTTLCVTGYPMRNLPESLCDLVSLTKLNFMLTKVKVLPAGICKLTDLRKLYFDQTPLDSAYQKNNKLSNRLYKELPNLEYPLRWEDS